MISIWRLSPIVLALASITFVSDANADLWYNCKSRGEACAAECGTIGASCPSWALHPHTPTYGLGELYACKNGKPTWTCSWQYKNGTNCTAIYPFKSWFCSFPGGKQETDE
jgi:hypothetical protein